MTRRACLDGPATAALSDQLLGVYRAAMGAPPFHETDVETGWFAQELADELTEPGFRCWVASDDDGQVAGFAYGFPTTWTPRPRPCTTPSGSGSWAGAPSAGTTPSGSCSAPTSGHGPTPRA